jgi:trypsin
MHCAIFIAALCAAAASASRSGPLPAELMSSKFYRINEKIVGGDIAEPNSIPFQVSMQRGGLFGFSHMCGGSVMNENTIITAAHCCDGMNARDLQVVAGEHDLSRNDGTEQTRAVSKVVGHEDFKPFTLNNDMCLLILDSPLELNTNVAEVKLPAPGQLFRGDATVSGWGTLRAGGSIPDELRVVTVPTVSDADCKDAYSDSQIVAETMLCAGEVGKDSCQGDSGGPLICDGVQCGVVSWGISCAEEYPGVYAEVSNFIDWLDANAA